VFLAFGKIELKWVQNGLMEFYNIVADFTALFEIHVVPKSAADIHHQRPDNTCSHTTRLTSPMYFN
jgi:hypothetical protein